MCFGVSFVMEAVTPAFVCPNLSHQFWRIMTVKGHFESMLQLSQSTDFLSVGLNYFEFFHSLFLKTMH